MINKIKEDHQIEKQIDEPFAINIFSVGGQSTSGLNGKFVFFQVLIDCLLKLKSTDEDKNELIQLLKYQYKENTKEIENINRFEKEYLSTKVLQWYTEECFFYKTLNSILRTENIHWMFLYRSYIFDLQQQLRQNQCKDILKVYRAQKISKDELDSLQNSLNQFISINSFFSTSTDRSKALSFFNLSKSTENIEKILFEIEANPNLVKTKPFANISKFSDFPDENEILFMIGSIFRLTNISFDKIQQNWIIQMTLASDEENDLREVLIYMQKQIGNKQTDLRILAKILSDMGKFDLAEKYLQRFLKQLSPDDHLRVDLYKDLAKVASQMGNYNKSTEWSQQLIRFFEQNPSAKLIGNLDESSTL